MFRRRPDKGIALAAAVCMLLLVSAAAYSWGCAGEKEPRAWLDQMVEAASGYMEEGGYLRFRHEMEYMFAAGEANLEQKVVLEGYSIFPDRQRYDYRETLTGVEAKDQVQENAFSYLTIDGGKTAYVEGERLTDQFGVVGWIHYTPSEEEGRYFDYQDLINTLTGIRGEVTELEREEVEGTRCVHLQYGISGQDMFQMQLQENPLLEKEYNDMDISDDMDVSSLFKDTEVEIWIGEEDGLPRRIIMSQSLSEEDTFREDYIVLIQLSGYGDEPPRPIEQPAFFTEAA